jgi:hypothetical protein
MSNGGSRYSTGATNNNGQNPFASPSSPFASQSSSFFSSPNPYNGGFSYAQNPYSEGATYSYIDLPGPVNTESGDAPQTGGLSYAGPQNTVTYSVEPTPTSMDDFPTGGGKPAPPAAPEYSGVVNPTQNPRFNLYTQNSYGSAPPKFQGGLGSLQFYRP